MRSNKKKMERKKNIKDKFMWKQKGRKKIQKEREGGNIKEEKKERK